MAFIKFPTKDSAECLDYTFDFTDWVIAPAVLISSGTTVVQEGTSSPGGLTDIVVDLVLVSANKVIAFLSGGTNDETYTLICTALDDNGQVRRAVRRATLKIKDK